MRIRSWRIAAAEDGPGTSPTRVVPLAPDKPAVPGEQGRRCHREYLAPPPSGDQPRQCREPQPVARLVTDPADLAAQHGVLMPGYQKLGVLGHLVPGQHCQAAQQATYKQVDDRNDHSAMIPASPPTQARSSNRAHRGRLLAAKIGANVTSYPAWQHWLREHQPPLQVIWGRYDPSFQVDEAEAYGRDVPGAEVRILDAGHFALDEQPDLIADLIRGFLQRHRLALTADEHASEGGTTAHSFGHRISISPNGRWCHCPHVAGRVGARPWPGHLCRVR
jgi:pimeloyl-ACP methyl ester carboxylesterase